MVTEFKLPELGEDIETGDVISVLVSVGDTVDEEQPIMEIETEKATIEVPAPVSGVVKEIHVKEGDKIKVGQLLITFDGTGKGEKAEGKVEVEEVKEEKTEVKAKDQEDRVEPEEAEERVEETREGAELESEERKEEREKVKAKAKEEKKKGEKKAKAKAEEREETEAKVEAEEEEEEKESKEESKARAKEEREDIEEGEKEAKKPEEKAEAREGQGEVVEFGRKARAEAEPETPKEPAQEPAPAAPSVRRLARELGIDINQVPGSGPRGRISEEDIKNYARWIITRGIGAGAETQTEAPTVTPAPLPDFTQWGEVERKTMTNVRRKTAEVMISSWMTVPHVTQHDKADITNIEKLRKEFGKKAEEAGGKLTVTAILLKVVALALKTFPQFNASVDLAKEEIIYKKYYNIGVAIDTERGLYVPVIRDVDKKNIIELSVELVQLSEKTRNRKISMEDLKGGTFTVSNQGSIGGIYFSPIIYWPEVAILGISRGRTEPVYVNGQFEPRLMLPLSLSHDHRVIDGADAVRFLRWIVEALEEPFRLIL
ncbi:MAG TPA: 2-oxo acid dehydrogenase subunit E2 [Thermodesulfobacteriota bacterium]|nr:2-oxo acid dehydrogenase subunit E2 [Thermodesulfobacteriota bacterium]